MAPSLTAFADLLQQAVTEPGTISRAYSAFHGYSLVECGYERMAEVQEEILWICEAAHTPVIWATQVLESLAKTGVPSRAEVTDAAMSERAECVMLNKGPYVRESVRTLDDILRRMQSHQSKKRSMLRPLRVAHDLLGELAKFEAVESQVEDAVVTRASTSG